VNSSGGAVPHALADSWEYPVRGRSSEPPPRVRRAGRPPLRPPRPPRRGCPALRGAGRAVSPEPRFGRRSRRGNPRGRAARSRRPARDPAPPLRTRPRARVRLPAVSGRPAEDAGGPPGASAARAGHRSRGLSELREQPAAALLRRRRRAPRPVRGDRPVALRGSAGGRASASPGPLAALRRRGDCRSAPAPRAKAVVALRLPRHERTLSSRFLGILRALLERRDGLPLGRGDRRPRRPGLPRAGSPAPSRGGMPDQVERPPDPRLRPRPPLAGTTPGARAPLGRRGGDSRGRSRRIDLGRRGQDRETDPSPDAGRRGRRRPRPVGVHDRQGRAVGRRVELLPAAGLAPRSRVASRRRARARRPHLCRLAAFPRARGGPGRRDRRHVRVRARRPPRLRRVGRRRRMVRLELGAVARPSRRRHDGVAGKRAMARRRGPGLRSSLQCLLVRRGGEAVRVEEDSPRGSAHSGSRCEFLGVFRAFV